MPLSDQLDDRDFPAAEGIDDRPGLLYRHHVYVAWLPQGLSAAHHRLARRALCLDGVLEIGERQTEFVPGCRMSALCGHDCGEPDREAHGQVVPIRRTTIGERDRLARHVV